MRESSRALEAYRVYERLGPQRSIDAVARQLDKSRQLIGRWCTAHGWVERVRAYDAQIAQEAEGRSRAERLAQIEQARKQRLQVARVARGKGVEAFAFVKPERLAENTDRLIRMLEFADVTERKDMGEPDQRVEVGGADGAAIVFEVRHVQRGDSTATDGTGADHDSG